MSDPLTEEELGVMVLDARDGNVYRLVAEVRRLRSDEWLRTAILELAPDREEGWSGFTTDEYVAEMLDLLRKHRDGRA